MWKEPSAGIAAQTQATAVDNDSGGAAAPRPVRLPDPAVVASVEPGSIGEDLGFQPGDRLLRINGIAPRDLIDVQVLQGEEDLILEVEDPQGTLHVVELEKDADEGLGLGFTEALFDGLRQCNNHCPFCFIDQQPPGRRASLYLKDDDYRLSFLYGSYLTLTNLTAADWQRIEEQRLSPLYVSVHATDPELRRSILGLKRDDRLLDKIDRLLAGGITLHTQIVVCPDINDGAVLEGSIRDLAGRHPGVLSVAVVPVGLTGHRAGLSPLRAVDPSRASDTTEAVDLLRAVFREEMGFGFVYCSDEWYIRAGREIPPVEYYDDFPQIENGVGMVRDFLEGAERLDSAEGTPRYPGRLVLVTGMSMAGFIEDFARRLAARTGAEVRTAAVTNRFYGESVTVSGLLSGGDIILALEGIAGDETVVLPPNCLNDDGLFLDDLTPEDIARKYGVAVVQGEYDPVATFFQSSEQEY